MNRERVEAKSLVDYIDNLQQENKHLNIQLDQALKDYDELLEKIDRAISFIGLLHNNLKDYTEYEEYTNIFNEMLKDIEEILGDKENE